MLISLRLDLEADQPPPLLQLHRRVSHGFFDRLSAHLDALWEHADETVTDAQDFLDNVLERNDWGEDDEDEHNEDSDHLGEAPQSDLHAPADQDPQADNPVPPATDKGAPRRWPRRTS
jgi:hypothetical protein